MNRLASLTFVVVALAGLSAAGPRTPPEQGDGRGGQDAGIYRGIVFHISADQLTLVVRAQPKQFVVGRETLVLVNGNGGEWRDVRPGYLADVVTVTHEGKLRARLIDAVIPR